MQTRRLKLEDLYEMQNCNLRCLPENYNIRYYLYHYLLHPQLLWVSTDYNNKMAGYVLAKIDDENDKDSTKPHGHITSLAVLRSHRKLGIATNVMNASMDRMQKIYSANFCSLHVRRTNAAALHLYQESLGFRCCEVDAGYYMDGEDAFHMKKYFPGKLKKGVQLFFVEKGKLLKDGTQSKAREDQAAKEKTQGTAASGEGKGGAAEGVDSDSDEDVGGKKGGAKGGKAGGKGGKGGKKK
jgi:ribosomal protein S18 acetylase RimI-like enzyme